MSAGLLVFGSGRYDADWHPVEEPIDLTRPGTLDVSFEARRGADYHFGVEVDPSATSSCLLGIRRSSRAPACTVEDPLDVAWQVLSGSEPVVSGSMDDWPGSSWGGAGGEAAELGHIPADAAGPAYRVEVRVRSASPGLATLNPRLVVGIGGGVRHSDMAIRLLAMGLGLFSGLAGAVVAFRAFRRERTA